MALFRNLLPIALRASRTPHIWTIPYEIIQMILDFGSAQDRICFALSCRYLFSCLEGYLRTQKLELRQLLPPEKRVPFCPNVKQRPRIQLLVRLENKRWKYCSVCWKLHPRSSRRMHQEDYRRCRFPFYGLRTTTPDPKEIDICPCLSILFSDKLELLKACDLARESTHPGRKYYYNKTFYHPSYGKRNKFLRHDCTFADHPFAKVQIETSIWFQEENRSLRVHNCYHFKTHQQSKGTLAYPQNDIEGWLRRFFHDAGSEYLGHPRKPAETALNWYWVEQQPRDRLARYSLDLFVTRDLGNAESMT